MNQIIMSSKDNYKELDEYLLKNKCKKLFVVGGERAIKSNSICNYLNSLKERLDVNITYFSNFTPNPTYDSVCDGIKSYIENECDSILAIGGGSAIDVAKCVKLFLNMDHDKNYLKQEIIPNDAPLIAVPTTAGTGSEATRFAVIYYNGEKQSVTDNSSIPQAVLFDPSFLDTLPTYQKKATVLDTFSHGIESIWSINSTEESKKYAKEALSILSENMWNYIDNIDENINERMLVAANLAGKAINITQTTAGHALCYKLTSLYNIAHGHAAALVNSELFPYMISHMDRCVDERGKQYLIDTFKSIVEIWGYSDIEEGCNYIKDILKRLELYSVDVYANDLDVLVSSVNTTRLKNNPIGLEKENIEEIYINLLKDIRGE